MDKQAILWMNKQTKGQMDKLIDKQTYYWIDKEVSRQTN